MTKDRAKGEVILAQIEMAFSKYHIVVLYVKLFFRFLYIASLRDRFTNCDWACIVNDVMDKVGEMKFYLIKFSH